MLIVLGGQTQSQDTTPTSKSTPAKGDGGGSSNNSRWNKVSRRFVLGGKKKNSSSNQQPVAADAALQRIHPAPAVVCDLDQDTGTMAPPPMCQPRLYAASCVTHDGNLFVVGGQAVMTVPSAATGSDTASGSTSGNVGLGDVLDSAELYSYDQVDTGDRAGPRQGPGRWQQLPFPEELLAIPLVASQGRGPF